MAHDYKMVHQIRRRMRCEGSHSCKKLAVVCIGIKGIELPLCEDHYKMLVDDTTYDYQARRNRAGYEGMMKAMAEKKEAEAKAQAEAAAALPERTEIEKEFDAELAAEEKAKKAAARKAKMEANRPAPGTEFYVCKHCGEKFDKATTTSQEFMNHCRLCKKEHEK